MFRVVRYLLVLITSFTLISCGGGGQDPSSDTTPQSASFVDSPVEGLQYAGPNLTGTTDSNGTFLYNTGDTVEFLVGDISIGNVVMQGQSVITPIDLVPAAVDETHPTVINIVRFLLSLDEDQDPSNGIRITTAISNAALNQSLDFSATNFDTVAANLVDMLSTSAFGSTCQLVTTNAALSHFRETLGIRNPVGTFSGTFIGDVNGIWTFTINNDNSIEGCSLPDGDPVESVIPLIGTANNTALTIDVESMNSGFTFNGTIENNDNVTGTWANPNESGTYSGTRTTSPALVCGSDNTPPPPGPDFDPTAINEDIAEIAFRAIKPFIEISPQPNVLSDGNLGTPINTPQDPAFSRESQITCGSNPDGTRSILHNGLDNPGTYAVIYNNCEGRFVHQQARLTGRVDASNFSGSGSNTKVTLSISNFLYSWNAGEVAISGTIDVDSIGPTSIINQGNLSIEHTDPLGFNGPTVTTYDISSLKIDFANSPVSNVDTTFDVLIIMNTSADDDELIVETPIPLDFPIFSQIPRSGSLRITENVIGGAIVSVEDRLTGDVNSDFNFIDITTDFNANGIIDGLDYASENQWQFLDY